MIIQASSSAFGWPRSVFTGVDVCDEAGLMLPAGTHHPIFEDDVWDFTEVIGLPVQMQLSNRRFDFTAISDPRWRLVTKELILALLAPRHEAVAGLPRALRTPLHLNTCQGRLAELSRWFDWLTARGVASLDDIDSGCCDAYLAHRRYVRDEAGVVVGDRSPALRRTVAQTVVDLLNYRELFTADRVRVDLQPWSGASPSSVAEMRSGRDENKTPPLEDRVLQPVLASALHLVTVLGPHVVELAQQVRDADHRWKRRRDRRIGVLPSRKGVDQVLTDYEQAGQPLPLLPEHIVQQRIDAGWHADDPLTPLALDLLARQAGFVQFDPKWTPHLRDAIKKTLDIVGTEKSFGRDAVQVARADNNGTVAWTLPLHRPEALALVGVVRTAAIVAIATISGMRSSELMELQIGCRRPPQEFAPGLVRHRLVSRVVKGQPLGGTEDEWVVVEPVHQAVGLAEQLHHEPRDGTPLFGRFAFDVRYRWFRNWVNSPVGQRLGLAPIPEDNVTLRALRRTLALELAYRPGGLLAAKIHLKHISVATTEGYSSRPGGAQAELLAEVNKHETERNLDLVLAEFRNYQQGIQPAGPGARELTAFFAAVDDQLQDMTGNAPKVQRSNREVLNLLTKRASTLHLSAANYCWFTDPSRALCLKLAGTPTADRPLAGMCDSARCPQATHHPRHRPVWAEHTQQTKTFLGSLGPTRKAERTRLQADYDRAQRILASIDAAATPNTEE